MHALLEADADRVFAVHLDGWRDPTRSWADRVLLGDRAADIAVFLAIPRAGGYDDWLELEILSDDGFIETAFEDSLWARDPVEMVHDGRERVERLWAAAGTSASSRCGPQARRPRRAMR